MLKLKIEEVKNELNALSYACIGNNEVFTIETDDGSVVLLSEDLYFGILESIHLEREKDVYDDIKKVVNTSTIELIHRAP